MSATYKKGEIVWAKIQGYSWWPGRITSIKLKLCIMKNSLGKYILKYEKEPYFYVTFFPNDSISKVKLKYIQKFIDGYKLRTKIKKGKKLTKAIDIATRTFLDENPNLSMDIKKNIFDLKFYSKKKFHILRQYLALGEDEEEQKGELDIQSFIDSEMDECEKYKNQLKDKNKKIKYIGYKRKKSKDEEYSDSFNSENDESDDDIDKNKKYNKELKKYSNELYKITVEIKRKNKFNKIMNIFNLIESIINKYDIEFNFNIIKDLLFILNNYTSHNNEIIMNKSISLNKDLICKFLDNLFKCNNEFLEKELKYIESLLKKEGHKDTINNFIINTEQIGQQISLEIDNLKSNLDDGCNLKNEENSIDKNKIVNKESEIINQLGGIKTNKENNNCINNNIKSNNLKNKNKKIYNLNQELNDAITVNNSIDNEISNDKNKKDILNNDSFNNNEHEPLLKDILNNPNYFNKKPKGQLYPDNFFKEIYLKVGITSTTELLRKKMCMQLYNILKMIQPFCQEDIIRNNVVFLEYLARHKDPSFGNKYMTIINMIYNRIKSEAVKIKNNNIKQ